MSDLTNKLKEIFEAQDTGDWTPGDCIHIEIHEFLKLGEMSRQLTAERDAWIESAAMMDGDARFYQSIVKQIGGLFGEAARTSDDGSIQQDVLALKVPELVEALQAERDALKATLQMMTECEICKGGDVTPAVPGNEHYIERDGIRMLVCDYHHAALTPPEAQHDE